MSHRSKWKIKRELYDDEFWHAPCFVWSAYPPGRSFMPYRFLTWRAAIKFVNAVLSGSRPVYESR
jgi:hypothetical protein